MLIHKHASSASAELCVLPCGAGYTRPWYHTNGEKLLSQYVKVFEGVEQ